MPRSCGKGAAADPHSHTGRRVACKNCRQAKMRCELSSGGRLPCARCRRMDRECRIETHFKRINKQEKLEELEKELRQLQSSITSGAQLPEGSMGHQIPIDTHSPVVVDSMDTELGHDHFPAPLPSVSYVDTPQLSPMDHLATKPVSGKSLDLLKIDSDQIRKLFLIFFNYYHPHLPFLTPTISPDAYYQRSPLLFWTIVYVASRRYDEEPDLVVSLTPSIKGLLWEAIANPPHTLELVQSILLVCAWPFPTSSMATDNTFTLITTAHVIATRLGLHRPEAIRDFSRTNRRLSQPEICECLKTWATCYIVFQCMAAIDGQPSPFSDWAIDRLGKHESSPLVPESIHQQVRIYRFETRACASINALPKFAEGVPRSGESTPLLALIEREFVELCDSFGEKLTEENSILLDGMGLRLYVYYLIEPSGSDARKRSLLRAFSLSIDMIHKFSVLAERPNFTECAPHVYFQTVSLGAMLILKITYSSYSEFVDCEEGKRMFHIATQLVRRMSLEDNDLPGRMSKILTQLWSAYARAGPINEEPTLKLRTRLSASLLHDLLWCWRETFGGQGHSSVANTVLNTGVDSNSSYGLPTQPEMVSRDQDLASNLSGEYGFDMSGFEYMLDSELMSLFPLSFEGSTSITS